MVGTVLGIGALLCVAGAVGLWFRAAQAVRIPRNRAGFVAVWLGGALLGAVALAQGAGWVGGVPAGLAIVLGGFLCFTVSISRQKLGPGVIAVGEKLREFRALDENGEIFEAASLAGHPVLLKFFRGHW